MQYVENVYRPESPTDKEQLSDPSIWSRGTRQHESIHSLNRPARCALTASSRWVIRSFLSLAFLRPANAIFVPGMYWRVVSMGNSIA